MAECGAIPQTIERSVEHSMTFCFFCQQMTATRIEVETTTLNPLNLLDETPAGEWTFEHCMLCHALKLMTFISSEENS